MSGVIRYLAIQGRQQGFYGRITVLESNVSLHREGANAAKDGIIYLDSNDFYHMYLTNHNCFQRLPIMLIYPELWSMSDSGRGQRGNFNTLCNHISLTCYCTLTEPIPRLTHSHHLESLPRQPCSTYILPSLSISTPTTALLQSRPTPSKPPSSTQQKQSPTHSLKHRSTAARR